MKHLKKFNNNQLNEKSIMKKIQWFADKRDTGSPIPNQPFPQKQHDNNNYYYDLDENGKKNMIKKYINIMREPFLDDLYKFITDVIGESGEDPNLG